MGHFAQVDAATGEVLRVIVADDISWPQTRLGGTWVETADADPDEQYAGPGLYQSDLVPRKFCPVWVQPAATPDAYAAGQWVWHNGRVLENLKAANLNHPGMNGWRSGLTPANTLSQLVGVPEVATGTATIVAGTYAMSGTPVASNGRVRRFRVFTLMQSSTVAIRRFTRSGNTFTQVGPSYPVKLSPGANGVTVDIPVNAGEILGFYTPASTLRSSSAVVAGGGWHQSTSDVSSFTHNSPLTGTLQAAFDIDYTEGHQSEADTAAAGNPAVVALKAILDSQGVAAGYLFDEPSGAYLDFSKNKLHIPLDDLSPPRVAEGLLFPGDKSFPLPGFAIKTVVACHFYPDPVTQNGSIIYHFNGGAYTVASFVSGTSASMSGLSSVRIDTQPGSLTRSQPMRGGWSVGAYQFTDAAVFPVRIGADSRAFTTSVLKDANLAVLLAFDRNITRDELIAIQDAIVEICNGRGIVLPQGDRPAVLNGVTAASAVTPFTVASNPYPNKDWLTHPSVIDIEVEFGAVGAKWNGYRYWMAITPFPAEPIENPCIFACDDGQNWITPPGVTNPIEPVPVGGGYNSDTDLAFDAGTQTMHLLYRPVVSGTARVVHTSSTDGWVTRTANKTLLSELMTADQLLSPSMFFDTSDSKWKLYAVRQNAGKNNQLLLRESAAADGPYGTPIVCEMPRFYPHSLNAESSLGIWHLEVQPDARVGGYICLASTTTSGGGPGALDAMAFTSTDGKRWFVPDAPLMTSPAGSLWDSSGMYRLSGVKTATGYDIFYSAKDAAQSHRTGRTSIVLP